MEAKTINEVIAQLDEIIHQEKEALSCLAYFPILYKKVTIRIKKGIENDEFEDGARMEKLDVIFANRFIDAYRTWKAAENTTLSWRNAFEASSENNLLILQHLLLGINAHINLDLGVAAAQTVGKNADIETLKSDFDAINNVLSSMIDSVKDQISIVSPLMILVEKFGNGNEEKLVSFSINIARKGAWDFAKKFHNSDDEQLEIDKRDKIIGQLAHKLANPKGRIFRWLIRFIRFFEESDVKKVISALDKE
ncbi:MAG: DUF5995 family protein [Chitinophagales bacterium]